MQGARRRKKDAADEGCAMAPTNRVRMLDRSESNICGLLLKHWTIPSDAAKDREAIESTSRDEAGAYSTECRLQKKKRRTKRSQNRTGKGCRP